jgi:hypothetical protein
MKDEHGKQLEIDQIDERAWTKFKSDENIKGHGQIYMDES